MRLSIRTRSLWPSDTRALTGYRRRTAVGLLLGLSVVVAFGISSPAAAQSCYGLQSYGGASTVNLVSAVPDVGTSPSNMNALESPTPAYYQLSTFAGPASVTIATALVSGSIADNDKAPLGLTFINGSAADVKIRQVRVQSDRSKLPLFRTSPKPTNIGPLVGTWAVSADRYDAVWTAPSGGYTVPLKSAQGFLANIFVSNVGANILGDLVGGSITTCASVCNGTDDLTTYVAQAYATDLYVPISSQKVATAVVGFVDGGNFPRTTNTATYGPPANLIGGQVSTIRVRAKEWSGNQSIASGLRLTVTLPAQWTNVSVTAAGAPWNLATATVSGSSATGWTITISTNAVIQKGTSTGDVTITATPPVVYTKSTFQAKASLSGHDTSAVPAGGHPIRSVCDGGGTVLPVQGGGGSSVLNVEFLSPRLNAGPTKAPVEQIDFRTDFDIINDAEPISVTAQAYNFTTNTWQTISGTPVTPSGSNVTITETFSGDSLFDLLDDQMRMRVRFFTSVGGPQTLRIDYLTWNAQAYWAVDNTPGIGSDTWPAGTKFAGSTKYPFASFAQATSVTTGGERVRVMVGASQSGTPYPADVALGSSAAGTATCRTWFEGVTSGSQMPRLRGADPTLDWGFDVAADHVRISGFRIENMYAALLAENPATDVVFDGNSVELADLAYGIVLNNFDPDVPPTAPSTGLQATNNTIDGTGFQAFSAIMDLGAQASVIDGNRLISAAIPGLAAMYIDGATAPLIQRNIVTGNYIGIYLARTTNPKLYNNTVDGSTYEQPYRGIHCESSTSIVSRNNIIARYGIGFSTDTPGSVDSNYDGFWANTTATDGFTTGANSLAADPLFVQTTTPSLATYYQPGTGSACIDAGTNLGLPFLGLAPDLGAVESH